MSSTEMLTIRRATVVDIPLIRGMAEVVFRRTYADILSPAQMEYMMEWMYSEESLRGQIVPEGKTFCIAEFSKPARSGGKGEGGEATGESKPNGDSLDAGSGDQVGNSQTSRSGGQTVRSGVLGEGGRPAGYVSFEYERTLGDGRRLYHLQKLYVLPEFQGRGLGKAMLEHVIGSLSGSNPGGFRMELNVNRGNPAVGFYEHCGLRRDRQGDFPIGNGYFMNDYIYALDVPAR